MILININVSGKAPVPNGSFFVYTARAKRISTEE